MIKYLKLSLGITFGDTQYVIETLMFSIQDLFRPSIDIYCLVCVFSTFLFVFKGYTLGFVEVKCTLSQIVTHIYILSA